MAIAEEGGRTRGVELVPQGSHTVRRTWKGVAGQRGIGLASADARNVSEQPDRGRRKRATVETRKSGRECGPRKRVACRAIRRNGRN